MESCCVRLRLIISLDFPVVSVVQPLEHWQLVTPSSALALEEGLASYLLVELGNENSCLTVSTKTWYYTLVVIQWNTMKPTSNLEPKHTLRWVLVMYSPAGLVELLSGLE